VGVRSARRADRLTEVPTGMSLKLSRPTWQAD
jgi:hypothetical protein